MAIVTRENRFVKLSFDGRTLTLENRAADEGFLFWARVVHGARTLSESRLPLPKIGAGASAVPALPASYPAGRCYLNVVGRRGDESFKEQFLLSDLPFDAPAFPAFAHRATVEDGRASLFAKDFSCLLSDGGIASLKIGKELFAKGKTLLPCLIGDDGAVSEHGALRVFDADDGLSATSDGKSLSFSLRIGKNGRTRVTVKSASCRTPAITLTLAEGFDALLWEGAGLSDGETTVGEYRASLSDLQKRDGESGIRRQVRMLGIGDRSGYPFVLRSSRDMTFAVADGALSLIAEDGQTLDILIEGGNAR